MKIGKLVVRSGSDGFKPRQDRIMTVLGVVGIIGLVLSLIGTRGWMTATGSLLLGIALVSTTVLLYRAHGRVSVWWLIGGICGIFNLLGAFSQFRYLLFR